MSGLLDGLDPGEQLACRVAERTLNVVAVAEDVPPKQGAVDALLHYSDGRRAAFEVTHLASDGGASHQLGTLLSGAGWPLPGKWWWTVQIGNPRDFPRLRQVFDKIVILCEAVGVRGPARLPVARVDADVRWLVEESSVRMWGHPDVPAVDGDRVRRATITRPAAGGFVDETFSKLPGALVEAFALSHIQRRILKLNRTSADERHLFVIIDVYDVEFSLFDALGSSDTLPTDAPVLPDGLTHVWLAPVCGRRFLLGCESGWVETRVIHIVQDGAGPARI